MTEQFFGALKLALYAGLQEGEGAIELAERIAPLINSEVRDHEGFRDFIEEIACRCIPGLPDEAVRDAQSLLKPQEAG